MAVRAPTGKALEKCKVLFCTRHFPNGFKFTKEALQNDAGVEVVACNDNEVAQHIRDAHIAVPFMAKLDEAMLSAARQLRMVIQYGVGVETTDLAAATRHGIWVSNIPSAGMGNALSCAEHIFYLTLALLRSAPQMAESVAHRHIGQPLGQTLSGKRVLVFGMGNIALELLPRLKAFDADVTVVRARSSPPSGDAAAAQHHIDEYGAGVQDLHRMLPAADIVVLTCTQNDATRGIVNSEFLRSCKRGVNIINVARGGLLDYAAVRQGLEDGTIGGLGLDVAWQEPLDPSDPVFRHPRVVLSPHVAGVTELSYRNMAQRLAAEVRRVARGEAPSVVLNPPQDGR